MINREIMYERDVHKSYMKIPAIIENNFDEKLLFRRNYAGCISMEKCFVNGKGQYWYNITGKQALDAYCRVTSIGQSLFETLILRICNQLEQLEWNLIDVNCLMLDPELIFVNNRGEDISFTLYPCSNGNFSEELQQLLEYLLTKIDHGDQEAVQAAYRIYEITLSDGYSMNDLKGEILKKNSHKRLQEVVDIKSDTIKQETVEQEDLHRNLQDSVLQQEEMESKKIDGIPAIALQQLRQIKQIEQIEETLARLYENAKDVLHKKILHHRDNADAFIEKEKDIPEVVYPEEEPEEYEYEIHPTICLSTLKGETKGVLRYEGVEGYGDFALEQQSCFIGKNNRVRMRIEKDTISQFHARIDYIDSSYYIEDLNSTNGTFVNDEILNYKERKLLHGGETIRFADVKYRFL